MQTTLADTHRNASGLIRPRPPMAESRISACSQRSNGTSNRTKSRAVSLVPVGEDGLVGVGVGALAGTEEGVDFVSEAMLAESAEDELGETNEDRGTAFDSDGSALGTDDGLGLK